MQTQDAVVKMLQDDKALETVFMGFDPGHSSDKFAMVQGDEVTTYALPAAVGVTSRSRKDGLGVDGFIRTQHVSRQPFRVVFDGIEYLVGPNVDQFTEPIDRLDLERFTDSPELRAAFYAGIYRLLNGGPHRMALMMALPVLVLKDKQEAIKVEQGIQRWMVGEHVFSVDGVETTVTVTNVCARIPQPVATWFDWGMNTRGEWVKGKDAQVAPTLVVDEGYNTLDVLVIENGRIRDNLSGGNTLGMSRAAEQLMDMVENQYKISIPLYRASDLIKLVVSGQKGEIYMHGQRVDVTLLAKSCIKSLEAKVDNYLLRLEREIKETHRVLLTGGGAIAMSAKLLQRFPQAIVMYEPVLANARGLAKMAMRPGFLRN